jgi:hypothetical protein
MPDQSTDPGSKGLIWAILNPVTALSAVLGAGTQAFAFPWLDVLVSTIWANAGTAFTMLSIAGTQLAGALGVSTRAITILTVFVGALFVLKLADRFYGDFRNRLRDAQDD